MENTAHSYLMKSVNSSLTVTHIYAARVCVYINDKESLKTLVMKAFSGFQRCKITTADGIIEVRNIDYLFLIIFVVVKFTIKYKGNCTVIITKFSYEQNLKKNSYNVSYRVHYMSSFYF